jgi:DNA-binding response OmpR family regulator
VHIERGYQVGAIDYLVKPLDDQTLRAKVSVLIDLWRARQAERADSARRMRELERMASGAIAALATLDALPALLWTTDGEGRAVHGNRRFLQSGGELGQQALACLSALHPDDRDAATACWQRALASGDTVQQTWRVRDGAGADLPYQFLFQRVDGGPGAGWACLGQETPAGGASAHYLPLLSWLGHELRNPLAAMLSVMELRKRKSVVLAGWEQTVLRQLGRLKAVAAELSRLEREGGVPPTPIHGRGADPAVSADRPRVLLVDDNEDGLNALAELLRDAGADVATASTAAEALRVVVDFLPGAAIVDIGLPDMNGHELGRQLRAALGPKELRLFALSGFGARDDLERSRGAGFDDHFVKPPEVTELIKALGLD